MKDQLLWSFNDAMLNSIARQIRIRFEIQLRQDAGTVGTDGFDAEGELIGNVRNRVSGGDQTEHLVLTIRQEIVKQAARCRRVDEDVPQGVQQCWA